MHFCVDMSRKYKIIPGGTGSIETMNPVDTGRKLNVHKTLRRRPGSLLNVLRTFNL